MTPYTTAELAAIVERAEAPTPMNIPAALGTIGQFRTDTRRLAAEVIALRKALREVREWFVMATAPGNAGDDFVNDDGWEKATNIAAGLRALMPPEPS